MKYAVFLLALMFAGIATPSMAQKPEPKGQAPQKLTFEFEGKTIEVAKKDFPNEMNWGAAKKACKNLGNGWRLPSIEELGAMYEQIHMEGKGSFNTNAWYWSSSENDANTKRLYFNFEYGKAYTLHYNLDYYRYDAKINTGHVRAVRTLP